MLISYAQEPVAFWGGVTAGALGLTLTEDPLRTWIQETSAEAGVSARQNSSRGCTGTS